MAASFSLLRSFLYVPAHRRRLVDGAHRRGADAIVLDLEDGVPMAAKAQAREDLGRSVATVSAAGATVLVRVNRPWRLAWRDVQAAVDAGAHAVVLPKVDGPAQIEVIAAYLAELEAEAEVEPLGLAAIVESARGLLAVAAIAAASPRLGALIPGNEDLALSLGVEPGSEAMVHAIWPLVLAAKAHGAAAIGTVGGSADYRDLEGFRGRVELAARLGFEGSTCIHPDQVPVINDTYGVSTDTLARARRVVAAYEAGGRDAIGLDGRMVDRPVYLRAKRILEQAASPDA